MDPLKLPMRRICKGIWGLLAIFTIQTKAEQTPENMKKLSAQFEISTYPAHKASLLGLTSTDYTTIGTGFSGQYARWSFYASTFHETTPEGLVLSQFEENISCKLVHKNRFECTLFNTSVSVAKNSAVYMIPTLSFAWGKTYRLKTELTPYTWGFNTDVAGFTYSIMYCCSSQTKKSLQTGFCSKAVYTNVAPLYNGFIGEFSPYLQYRSVRMQCRAIYQFAHEHFIYDLGIQINFKLSQN